MLVAEKDSGIVEWRRGLLVLHSTDAFGKNVLPKWFNTRNFKTFRRQLNYYGFVHVRSFSTTGSNTTALWVNQDLARVGSDDVSSVLMLRRVEPCEAAKTAEGRRERKEQAIHTVEEDLGVSAKTLQMEQIRAMAVRGVAGGCGQDDAIGGGNAMAIDHYDHAAPSGAAAAAAAATTASTATAAATPPPVPPSPTGNQKKIGPPCSSLFPTPLHAANHVRTVTNETDGTVGAILARPPPLSPSTAGNATSSGVAAAATRGEDRAVMEESADAANLLLMLAKSA